MASDNRAYRLKISPPLLNSASPWATTIEQIKELYESPYTGAVTIRTSLLEGFAEDPSVHQYIYHNTASAPSEIAINTDPKDSKTAPTSTLNTLGYSPITLSEYLGHINEIVGQRHLGTSITTTKKPFILSVTGTPDEIAMAYALIANAAEMDEDLRLCMEVNLSCPNIASLPPPAYSPDQLASYLEAISDAKSTYRGRMATPESVPRVGIKLPPYTYATQFETVAAALVAAKSSEPGEGTVVDFVSCVNTLGSCLVLDGQGKSVVNSEKGDGMGGMAGQALHPLALGNVMAMRRLLDQREETRDVLVIGIGGVEDREGVKRMMSVGAGAVGCASALGRFGVGVFKGMSDEV